MRLSSKAWLATLALVPLSLLAAGPAAAASLNLNCTKYANGATPVACDSNSSPTPTVLTTPGTYTYSNTALQSASATGGIIPGSAYPASYAGASFYDAFVIQITASEGSSISSTIDLGSSFQITGFQERLYKLPNATTATAPYVGPIPSALDFWTTAINLGSTTGTVNALPSTHLDAGTYVLELRGNVTGSSGGAYSGTVHLGAPTVPLPAAAWLLLSGLAGFTGIARRRKNA